MEESDSTTYENSPEIISPEDVDYEAVAALEPDLILDVKSSGDQERCDKLSDIATTVGIPEKGEELNEARAEQYTEIADAHPDWEGKTVSAIGAFDTWGVYLEGSARLDPFLKLGFTLNEKISAADPGPNGFSVSLSDENLSDADADVVLAFPVGKEPDEVENNGAWKRLQATQVGHSFVVPEELSQALSLGSPSPTSTRWTSSSNCSRSTPPSSELPKVEQHPEVLSPVPHLRRRFHDIGEAVPLVEAAGVGVHLVDADVDLL